MSTKHSYSQRPARFLVPSLIACCGLGAAENADPIVIAGEQTLPYQEAVVGAASKTGAPLLEVPQSTSVITAEQIDRQGLSDFGQAFRYTPGVQGENFGFEPRTTFLRLRGFDAFEDGYFRDGMQMANPDFVVGYGPEPYGAERIEVLRGPASVLYGQGAPGGLVNYVDKTPQWHARHEMIGTVGNHERLQARFDSTAAIGESEELAYRVIGLLRDSESQVDFIGEERLYLAPSLSWRPSPASTWTVFGHYQQDATSPSQRLPAAAGSTRVPGDAGILSTLQRAEVV
ncbi:MAG: TonB-dependent siderophore receptor [Planctomycetota bacterium]